MLGLISSLSRWQGTTTSRMLPPMSPLYTRWLPLCRSSAKPCLTKIRMKSRNFMAAPRCSIALGRRSAAGPDQRLIRVLAACQVFSFGADTMDLVLCGVSGSQGASR